MAWAEQEFDWSHADPAIEAVITRLLRGWTWATDADHRLCYMSESVERYAGKPREWHYGKTREELGTVDYSQAQWRRYRDQLARRVPFDPVEFPRFENGKVFWMRTQGEPLFDETGRFLGYRGIAFDVTGEMEIRERSRSVEAAIVERTVELAQANEQLSIRLQQLDLARERIETLAAVKNELISSLIDEVSEPLVVARRALQQVALESIPAAAQARATLALALIERAETAANGMLLTAGLDCSRPTKRACAMGAPT